MTELPKPDFKKYVRPNDRWLCSLQQEQPCGGVGSHLGADDHCTPKPSLRLQRGIFSISCTAMVLGLLLACWNSPGRNDFLAPGQLTGHHAQILTGKGTDRCASCHGAGDKTLATWMRDAVSLGKHIPVSQSQLCMDCHDQSLHAEFAMLAHNLPAGQLESLTQNTVSTHSNLGFPDPRNSAGQLACATCHQEHHGADFNLSALTDNQCQTCHVNHFHSFERDHPEFNQWPFSQRTGIAFDHVSHSVKHFTEKNETFNCQQCHVDDQDGNVKLVASFETTCAQCHQERIVGDQTPDWTLLQLPMLDIAAMEKAGYSVGLWPESCSGDFDGQLPPPMKLLLMSDSRTAAILNRHGAGFQFSDLDAEDPDDVSDAVTLAWSIKELLFELTVKGNQEIESRLSQVLNASPTARASRGLTYGLHEAVFAQAQQQWIPGLLAEMADRKKQLNGDHRVPFDQVFGRPAGLTQEPQEETLAANPLAAIYNDMAANESSESKGKPGAAATGIAQATPGNQEPATTQSSKAPRLVVRDSNAPATSADSGRVNNSFAPDIAGNASSDQDLLAINPLAGLDSGKRPNTNPSAGSTPPKMAIDYPNAPPSSNEPGDTPNVTASKGLTPGLAIDERDIAQAIIRIESQSRGGWYRNDEAFKITYRASQHIDPLLKSWTDLAMEHQANQHLQHSNLFDSLNSVTAAGQCRSCHTVDQRSDSVLRVNWAPKYRDTSVRGFTRFSHRPHDIQTSIQDCTSCHQLEESQSNMDQFAGFSAHAFISNFAPISKSNCASCHRPGGASSGCVDCHNYHVGSKIPKNKR